MKVELQHITKTFFGIKALDDVSLSINGGEINCLVGENGAGKSTIIKIIAGFHEADEGEIKINDKKVHFKNPKDSQSCNISVIHQELMLIPDLTVAENIFLGYWPLSKIKLLDRQKMNRESALLLNKIGAKISPTRLVSALSTGEQQLVEIAKALSKNVELLVLDEPTASLSEVDANKLLDIVRQLKEQGIAVLYVSHRLDEVFSIADKITVYRDGKYVDCKNKSELSKDDVVKMMVGHTVLSAQYRRKRNDIGNVALQVNNITRDKKFTNICFDLHEGEVLGIAGLVGAGRSEILRAIYGQDSYDSGEILIYGEKRKIRHPFNAIKSGISLVPEDRKKQGLVFGQSIRNNIVLGILKEISFKGFIIEKKIDEVAEIYKDKLKIKMNTIANHVNSLSGGNQQKVVLARSLAMKPKILLLDEPTRGVDVGAREEIHRLVDMAVRQKLAVLAVSSDLEELIDISDRIIVLKEGKVIAEYFSDEITKEEVIRLATA
jgi:ribose transport system ATP-binding protein